MTKTASGLSKRQLGSVADGRAALAKAANDNDTAALQAIADAAAAMAKIQGRFEKQRPEMVRWARLASDAAREGGLILAAYREQGRLADRGGTPDQRSARNVVTYADLGFTNRTRPKRWELLAAVSDADYAAHWDAIEASDDMRPVWGSLLKADGGRANGRAPRTRSAVDGFMPGDFRVIAADLPDSSVDLIFTDPPYDRATLPLYEDLAEVAMRVLVDGGSLVTYFGQYQLPAVLEALSAPGLRYWWQLAVIHQGGQMARLDKLGVIVRWKPLLWFVKGTRAGTPGYIEDIVFSEPAKDSHAWQQGLEEATHCIEALSPADGFVFDPFCGGGTTAIAARDAGRRFLTCDVDSDALAVAKARFIG